MTETTTVTALTERYLDRERLMRLMRLMRDTRDTRETHLLLFLYGLLYTQRDVCLLCSFYFPTIEKKVDPTNRIRTSDLRNSINNYSPPLYQLSYGRCPFLCKNYPLIPACPIFIKKLHRRESNPGRKRERLECYQLHHNGFILYALHRLLFISHIKPFHYIPFTYIYMLIPLEKKNWIRPTGFEPVT